MLLTGGPKDELEVAIELSLQESHTIQEEERELTRYKAINLMPSPLMVSIHEWQPMGFIHLWRQLTLCMSIRHPFEYPIPCNRNKAKVTQLIPLIGSNQFLI